jgi:hypothetical protein
MASITLHGVGRMLLLRCDAPLSSDSLSVDSVRQELTRRRCRGVLLDVTRASYADSDGLRWLLALKAACDAGGIPLRILARKGGRVWRNLRLLNANRALFASGRAAWRGAPTPA